MEHKFKEGDKIRIHREPIMWSSAFSDNNPLDGKLSYPRIFIIEKIGNGAFNYLAMRTKDDYGFNLSCLIRNDNIELLTNNKNNFMTKLNSMMKKILDADTKKLIKAGLINGDLKLTPEGEESLMTVLFDAYKKDLIVMADEIINEEKKEEK